MFGRLIPIGGGDNIVLKQAELTLGRSDQNDIVLRFSNISGHHCRLALSNGYWYVVDQGSSNGVKVDGIRVKDRRIDPGAKVSFANHTYVLEYDPMENGAQGVTPADMLESDILNQSLLERAGVAKSIRSASHDFAPQEKKEPKKIDFDNIDIDDIEFL